MKQSKILDNMHRFIIGAPKCGTTSMAYWLDQHPDICVSRPKESKFFTSEYAPWEYESNYLRNYFRHYEGEKILVDANPMLMLPPFVPERIAKHCSITETRFVAMVREPIERMFSHWMMDVNMVPGRAHKTFERTVEKNLEVFDRRNFEFEGELPFNRHGGLMTLAQVEYGLYYDQIKRYMDIFGEENVLVVPLSDLDPDPSMTFDLVCNFFGVPGAGVNFVKRNVCGEINPKKQELMEMFPILEEAECIYREQVIGLSSITGIDFVKEWGYE